MTEDKIIDIEDLTPDAHNFNQGTDEGRQLMQRSLTELGAGRSILVDRNGNVIAGNKTQEAAIKAGIRKVRVIETDGTELVAVKRTDIDIDSAKGRELALVDNLATQINLEWDQAELEAIDVEGFDPYEWGWEPPEMGDNDEQGQGEQPEAKEDDFDPDEVHETKVKRGDVWQLGEHRLMCGDSTNADDVARLMNGERADVWLTDPPYNVDYNSKNDYLNKAGKGAAVQVDIENDKMTDEQFRDFLYNAFVNAESVMKEGCSFYIWTAQGHAMTDVMFALDKTKLFFRQQLIWNKNNLVIGRMDYQWKHEPCLYGWKEGAGHHWYSDRKQTSVIDWNKPMKSEYHPTMKPVGLFGYQIGNSSKPGDIILHTFGGSGTTIVAAEQLDRRARLMELDPHYCDVIIARWEKLTGGKATKLNP